MKHSASKYLLLTFLISWGAWLTDALLVSLTPWTNSDLVPMVLFTIGGFGPPIAACLCMEEGFSLRNLKKALFQGKKSGLLCLLILGALEVLVFTLSSTGFIADIPPETGPQVVVTLIVFIQSSILFGGNEELGWRGTLQPLLQKKLPWPVATLAVGCIWVIWHLPLWLIEGDSHQSMSFLFFAGLGLPLSFWLGAIFNSTGCVAPCMILHGLTNTLMGILNYDHNNPLFIAGVLVLTAGSFLFYPRKTAAVQT